MFIRVLRLFGLAWDVKQPPPGLMPGTAGQNPDSAEADGQPPGNS
jgi:hypothetical protein